MSILPVSYLLGTVVYFFHNSYYHGCRKEGKQDKKNYYSGFDGFAYKVLRTLRPNLDFEVLQKICTFIIVVSVHFHSAGQYKFTIRTTVTIVFIKYTNKLQNVIE